MIPWLDDRDVRIYVGDVRAVLAELPDESVDCVITSPPYWGLRDYGTGSWAGGDPDCDHLGEPFRTKATINANCGTGTDRKNAEGRQPMGQTCGKCGARRVDQQLGLEPTPDLYVQNMVAVFREVRRVLAPHGTVWCNLGDTYNSRLDGSHGGWNGSSPDPQRTKNEDAKVSISAPGLKPKDLVGIPWRVAFALQADGWWLRSDIIWAKKNPMPESVTDRPTKSHEYVFLLSKQPRYWFDAEAVREPHRTADDARNRPDFEPSRGRAVGMPGGDVQHIGTNGPSTWPSGGRNVRSVWEIATQPFAEAHFATFPEELVRRCLLAGCPAEVCSVCGKPRERIVEREPNNDGYSNGPGGRNKVDASRNDSRDVESSTLATVARWDAKTVGWSDCGHHDYRPDDFELIQSPTGERVGDDPSLVTGRAGMNRPRHPDEGRRPITRYQQRMYANQLRDSPHRAAMTEAVGESTFAHYIRTDRNGARPVPGPLLEEWIGRGWLERVDPPLRTEGQYRPGVVLDPFLGSGTTALVARHHGRHAIGIELSAEYAALAALRLQQLSLLAEAPA